jgi:hypothetical protein
VSALSITPSSPSTARKLRTYSDKLDACIGRVLASLRADIPRWGGDVAIDASDVAAYANGQLFVSQAGAIASGSATPTRRGAIRVAVSTRKGAGFYSVKVHAAVCSSTGLPLAWRVETARSNVPVCCPANRRGARSQLRRRDVRARQGYDVGTVYNALEGRSCRPIISLRKTPAVKAGAHKPPTCEHGEWRFAGSDAKRGASKWRCPTGDCRPASR